MLLTRNEENLNCILITNPAVKVRVQRLIILPREQIVDKYLPSVGPSTLRWIFGHTWLPATERTIARKLQSNLKSATIT